MMNFDTNINFIETCRIISTFRQTCQKCGINEILPTSLVSHNDKSIRYTNSTTSVMKPWIVGEKELTNEGIFLVQPAMGLQGVLYWERTKSFGEYSSYFYSIGLLYPFVQKSGFYESVNKILTEIFDLQINNRLTLKFYEQDYSDFKSIIGAFNGYEYIMQKTPFRHFYGIDGFMGKDIILEIKDGDISYVIGNISIIFDNKLPKFLEFSIDSTLVLNSFLHLHPVLCLPSAWDMDIKLLFEGHQFDYIAYIDFITLCGALIIDGLMISSRGRGGNLKKIANDIIYLSNKNQIKLELVCQHLINAISIEENVVIQTKYYYSKEKCYSAATKFLEYIKKNM